MRSYKSLKDKNNSNFNNNLIKSIILRIYLIFNKQENCVYKSKNFDFKYKKNSRIFFYLKNNEFVHLGDFLFFIPLILFLIKDNKVLIYANSHHVDICKFFIPNEKNLSFIKRFDNNTKYDLIITQPYILYSLRNFRNVIGIGLPTERIYFPYPFYLIKVFINIFKINSNFSYQDILKLLSNKINNISRNYLNSNIKSNKKYILLAPFLGSGKISDLFYFKQRKLIKDAINFAKGKYEIIVLGGLNDQFNYSFNYIDMRGYKINYLMNMATLKNIECLFAFDNFWMHYFDILGKKSYILFRGKFSKIDKYNHHNSINVSFQSRSNKVYLN